MMEIDNSSMIPLSIYYSIILYYFYIILFYFYIIIVEWLEVSDVIAQSKRSYTKKGEGELSLLPPEYKVTIYIYIYHIIYNIIYMYINYMLLFVFTVS